MLKISTVIKFVRQTADDADHELTLYLVPVRQNMSVELLICLRATHLTVTVLPVFLIMDAINSELYCSSGKHFGFSVRVNLITFKYAQ